MMPPLQTVEDMGGNNQYTYSIVVNFKAGLAKCNYAISEYEVGDNAAKTHFLDTWGRSASCLNIQVKTIYSLHLNFDSIFIDLA